MSPRLFQVSIDQEVEDDKKESFVLSAEFADAAFNNASDSIGGGQQCQHDGNPFYGDDGKPAYRR